MNTLQLIQLILFLGQGVLATLESKGTEVPREVIEDVQAALANLQKYSGQDVTFPQLEALRLTPQW